MFRAEVGALLGLRGLGRCLERRCARREHHGVRVEGDAAGAGGQSDGEDVAQLLRPGLGLCGGMARRRELRHERFAVPGERVLLPGHGAGAFNESEICLPGGKR